MEGLLSFNPEVDLKAKSFIPAHTSPLKCPVFLISSEPGRAVAGGKRVRDGRRAGMWVLELEGEDAHGSILALAPPEVLQLEFMAVTPENNSAAPGTCTALWDGGERKRHGGEMEKETEERWKRGEEEMEKGVEKREKGMEERWERG